MKLKHRKVSGSLALVGCTAKRVMRVMGVDTSAGVPLRRAEIKEISASILQ